ncbi:MAG: hypothetical protein ABI144_11320 [Gallionella sp.]
MKFSNTDFLLMRWSLVAISVSILLSGGILYASTRYADYTQNNQRVVQRQMNDARNKLNMARQDQDNLSIYATEYGRLAANEIIGDDHRLDWMEGLEKLRDQNLVINFSYNIAPQKVYAPQPAVDSGNYIIHYSEMKLQFDLLHEGQLLNFFDALRRRIKGHYQLEGCTLQRVVTGGESGSASGKNIKAECSGGWITLKNRNMP